LLEACLEAIEDQEEKLQDEQPSKKQLAVEYVKSAYSTNGRTFAMVSV